MSILFSDLGLIMFYKKRTIVKISIKYVLINTINFASSKNGIKLFTGADGETMCGLYDQYKLPIVLNAFLLVIFYMFSFESCFWDFILDTSLSTYCKKKESAGQYRKCPASDFYLFFFLCLFFLNLFLRLCVDIL